MSAADRTRHTACRRSPAAARRNALPDRGRSSASRSSPTSAGRWRLAQHRQTLQLLEELRRPLVEFVQVGVLQRVLEFGLGDATADTDVLRGGQEQGAPRNLLQFGTNPVDEVLRGAADTLIPGFNAMNMRPLLVVWPPTPAPIVAADACTSGSCATM